MGNWCTGAWFADCISRAMLKQTPLPDKNQSHPDLKLQTVIPLSIGSSNIPHGAHNEARGLLLRFNPRLIGFGIATPSPNSCPVMSAPIPLCSVGTLMEKHPKEGQ